MNSKKRIFLLLNFSLVFLITTVSISAQAEQSRIAEPSYEAVLHVLAASGQAGPGEAVPPALSSVARQIKGEFGTSGLKVINTYFGRLSNTGNFEQKGVSSAYVQEPEVSSPIFVEWNLVGLRTMQNAGGQDVYQFQGFRFGARVPVRVATVASEGGTKSPVFNYEVIGITLQKMNIRENTPTLLGTLTQGKTEGTLFLVLTVKNTDK
ncbi:MAG: hypothetical protein HOP17_09070 [Acidobacteria bacterium]|nr:hypothetical protein [Acidobacteriota bacterium]